MKSRYVINNAVREIKLYSNPVIPLTGIFSNMFGKKEVVSVGLFHVV